MARKKQPLHLVEGENSPSLTIEKSKLCRVKYDDLIKMEPMNEKQREFFKLYDKQTTATLLHGVAGTGKTFIALYKAIEEVLSATTVYRKIIIVRSAVPSREMGFLPGDEKEKAEVYELPYVQIFNELVNHIQPYVRLQEQKIISFITTSFIRGVTLDGAVVIVDECQNMSDMELNTIMTRIGRDSKVIFCGDFRQTDLNKSYDKSGLLKFMSIAELMPSFKTIEFSIQDIVRSELVKEYIIARLEYEDGLAA